MSLTGQSGINRGFSSAADFRRTLEGPPGSAEVMEVEHKPLHVRLKEKQDKRDGCLFIDPGLIPPAVRKG